MTPFVNPVSQRLIAKRHGGSQMNSPRERTATGKQWQLSGTAEAQGGVHGVAIQRIMHEIGKLRRRVVGGGGGGVVQIAMTFKGEYNGGSYKTQNVVAYTPNGGSAGMYICTRNAPAGTPPDTGSPYWFAWPNSPPGQWGA